MDSARRPVRGLNGLADLRFELRGGSTVMTHARLAAPLTLVRPFEADGGRLVVPLTTIGPGFCAGDRCGIDVVAGPGAHVVITTTAASRILGMPEGAVATQRVHIVAAPGACVEYHPAITIPFPDSSFAQEIEVDVSGDGRAAVTEIWALGRTARDEYLQFRTLESRTRLRVDDVLLYADAMLFDGRDTAVSGAGVLEGRRYLAAGFWHGVDAVADQPQQEDVLIAFGQSAARRAFLRALGDDGIALARAVDTACGWAARAWHLLPIHLDRFRC